MRDLIAAVQTTYRSLYHYQPFKGEWKGYLESTLRDHTICMSQPQSFNDPWDCRPWFDLEILNDPALRDAHIEYFKRHDITGSQEIDFNELRENPSLLRYMVEENSKGFCDAINSENRVYCLTPKEDNALMWAHYADNHNGICLQFDTRTEPMSLAYKVYYQENLPVLRLTERLENPAIEAVLTKSHVWSYEEEFRLLARTEQSPAPNVPTTRDNLLEFDARALVGIVIGCQSSASDEIIEMVEKYQPSLIVKKASRKPHVYGLTIETIYGGKKSYPL